MPPNFKALKSIVSRWIELPELVAIGRAIVDDVFVAQAVTSCLRMIAFSDPSNWPSIRQSLLNNVVSSGLKAYSSIGTLFDLLEAARLVCPEWNDPGVFQTQGKEALSLAVVLEFLERDSGRRGRTGVNVSVRDYSDARDSVLRACSCEEPDYICFVERKFEYELDIVEDFPHSSKAWEVKTYPKRFDHKWYEQLLVCRFIHLHFNWSEPHGFAGLRDKSFLERELQACCAQDYRRLGPNACGINFGNVTIVGLDPFPGSRFVPPSRHRRLSG